MILVKFPSRERTDKLLTVLKMYADKSHAPHNIHYLISVDEDDQGTLSKIDLIDEILRHSKLTIDVAPRTNKIGAINRNVHYVEDDWTILVNGSDDMIPRTNWDKTIRDKMYSLYPDLDGCLWFNDGHQNRISTMVIEGREYYERFNYIYHPDYISVWCDNEYTEVAQSLGKMTYFEQVIFRHESPAWRKDATSEIIRDALFLKNESYFQVDKETYLRRKEAGFP